jgi:hypothetical protein
MGVAMDAGTSFVYMLKQPGGIVKILIGGILLIIPIFGACVVLGYALRTMRGVAAGDEQLPEWSDWGDLFVKGLIVIVAGIIYSIPTIILTRLGILGSLLSFVWSIFEWIVLPAAVLRYAVTDNFGAFFEFSAIFDFIKANASNYILAIVLALVAGFISMFGLILLLIGVLFTYFWAALVYAHLLGSVYRASLAPSPVV